MSSPILAAFLFGWEDLDKRCGELSGGELNRLQLARASALKANFLVLDEPTNHLDIPTREAVEDALEDFEGTVLVVSHDRYFLEKVAERVVFIEDGAFHRVRGQFRRVLARRRFPEREEGRRVVRRGPQSGEPRGSGTIKAGNGRKRDRPR